MVSLVFYLFFNQIFRPKNIKSDDDNLNLFIFYFLVNLSAKQGQIYPIDKNK